MPSRGLLSHVRILWLVLGALLLVSLLPILAYHYQVLRLSQDKLEDTERLQQMEITRLLAGQILLFQNNLDQQLRDEVKLLGLTGALADVNSPQHASEVTQRLEEFVKNNPDILYVTALNAQAKGPWSGGFRADRDPFVNKALQNALSMAGQGTKYSSGALAAGEGKATTSAYVLAVPLVWDQKPAGMLAVLVSLKQVEDRLQNESVRKREVFVVDVEGHIVAHPDRTRWVAGEDASSAYPIVSQIRDLPPGSSNPQSSRFAAEVAGHKVEFFGAFCPIPGLRWAVVAKRSVEDAQGDAGLPELNRQALVIALALTVAAIFIAYFFAVGISQPVRALADSTRAISRGEFHERAPVVGTAEISDLAENFNSMAGDIEQYIERLKQAAEETRQLFLGSIRMLAAAIDEKDPYTRGHSGRVAKYSIIIGEQLGLDPVALDKLRISALLHDVGKIGIDDRVLKKPGALTDEEFHIMKQHPVKGANIMRPVSQLKEMLPGIELHHECVDGRGYPYGLKADQIPQMARIIAVADTFDAITTNRPYQSAMDLEFALKRVRELAGSRFDPAIVSAMEDAARTGKLKLSATLVEV
ncbi:MAG TPA: HD domain-containing phosphohydrolase [Bryobacteraceae bacterium]|nr:HD domain-containing phosphohydrolase [Bryobacteraceae bacterium]